MRSHYSGNLLPKYIWARNLCRIEFEGTTSNYEKTYHSYAIARGYRAAVDFVHHRCGKTGADQHYDHDAVDDHEEIDRSYVHH